MLNVIFQQKPSQVGGALALACFETQNLSEEAQFFDQAQQGLLKNALKTNRFKGKKNEILILTAPSHTTYSRIILFGLGKADALSIETLQDAGGGFDCCPATYAGYEFGDSSWRLDSKSL